MIRPRLHQAIHRIAVRSVLLCLVFAGVTACDVTPAASPSIAQTALPSIGPAELGWWVEFRRAYGLQSDSEWAGLVASDPKALRTFGVPLLAGEEAEVIRLQMGAEALDDRVRGYGNRFPEEFAGAWIEAPMVVIAFTDHIGAHEAAVMPLFGPRVSVRPVRFTLRELQRWAVDVSAEKVWFETVGAELIEADAEQTLNAVEISYRARDRGVELQILAKFGHPEWIYFNYRGAGPWTGPLGSVELTVLDEDGDPAVFECLFVALDPRVTTEFAPRDVWNGKCFQGGLPAVDWRVDVIYERDGQRRTVTREITVPPLGVAKLEVVLEP